MMSWLRNWGIRLVAGLALATVASVAGVISYTHIDALTLTLGGSPMSGHLMPFGIDGLIVVGSVVLLTVYGGQARWGWLCIVPGVAASLFANFESGIAHGWLAAGWATMPAVSFAVATFVAERWLKAQGGGPVAQIVTVTVGCGHGVADERDERILDAWFHLKDCLGGEPTYRGVGLMLGVHNEIVRQVVTAVAGGGSGRQLAVPQLVPASANGSAP